MATFFALKKNFNTGSFVLALPPHIPMFLIIDHKSENLGLLKEILSAKGKKSSNSLLLQTFTMHLWGTLLHTKASIYKTQLAKTSNTGCVPVESF